MLLSRRWTDARTGCSRGEEGSASLEFLSAGVLLLVPLVYLVLALAALQGASFGIEGAARQASRVFVQAESVEDAEAAAARAIAVTLADYGLDADAARIRVSCAPHPDDCLAPRGLVTVAIEYGVPLPLAPPALELGMPGIVPVSAAATEQVSRFAGER